MGQELEKIQEQEQGLVDSFNAGIGDDEQDLVIPILKVGQALTQEVQDEEAKPGDLINSLTGENHGTIVEFVVSGFEKGRFRTNEDGDVICTGREGACPCHDTAYEDCPDSEEQYRAAVKRGDKEWGKGPPCATTYNFTGTIPGTDMPVRLSLMRSSAKAAKKLLTMLRFSRAPWDQVFQVETKTAQNKAGKQYHTVAIKQVRKTENDERQRAVALATALQQQSVNVVGSQDDEAAPGPRPEREEGIDY